MNLSLYAVAEQMHLHPNEILEMTYEEFLNLAMSLKMKVEMIKKNEKKRHGNN